MKQVRPVTGKTMTEFASALNEAYCELSRFTVEKTEQVSKFEALIFYEVPDDLPEVDNGKFEFPDADYNIEFADSKTETDRIIRLNIKVGSNSDRFCCECDNLLWGKGCPYANRHVKPMDAACPMFNVIIEGRF